MHETQNGRIFFGPSVGQNKTLGEFLRGRNLSLVSKESCYCLECNLLLTKSNLQQKSILKIYLENFLKDDDE